MRARDLLRERLARRGLTLSAPLLAPALATSASAAVTPVLYETTLKAATLFAAGNAAAGAVSGRAVLMAEGVLKTMFLTKLKAAAAVLIAVVLMGTGAGALMSHTPANDSTEEAAAASDKVLAAAPDPAPFLNEKPKTADGRRKIKKDLQQTITLDKGIDPNTPLKDALEFLCSEYRVQIIIDAKAFETIGVQKAEEQPVTLPRMKEVRLSTVLRLLLGQVKGDEYVGTYLLRPDYIEVTTTYHQLCEALGEDPAMVFGDRTGPPPLKGEEAKPAAKAGPRAAPGRRPTSMVQPEFEKVPLADALRDLAIEAGTDIVIDTRVADKAKTLVTLTTYNTLLDTSVTLLTDMADLDWVWIDKVI